MQLLINEFFGKIFDIMNNSPIFIKILLKFIFCLLSFVAVYFIVRVIYMENYILIIVILGLWFLAEIAHYIRKSREKVMGEKIKKQPDIRSILDKKASKNKVLLKINKPKNKTLLNNEKSITFK